MEQIETVRREFTKQAKNLEAYQTIFSKAEFNALAIEQMCLTGKERALEVAAGTCAFGRAIAPHVARNKIVSAMKDDIAGITQTGFEPYKQDDEIMFDHRWYLYIGKNKK